MLSATTAILVAFMVAAALTPAVRRLAIRLGAVDEPNRARRVHERSTPRMGGLAIGVAFYIAIFVLLMLRTEVGGIFVRHGMSVVALLGGGAIILALGAWDDVRGAGARLKFGVQIPVAVGLVAAGFSFSHIALPWGGVFEVGWVGAIVSVLWIVGITNAMNLIDGLDGLAAGIAALVAGTLLVTAMVHDNPIGALISGALMGSVLGFLLHNRHPASIFMGDTGSLFIGYVLAATGLFTSTKSATTVALLVPILALSLPITDTILATVRRLVQGKSPFNADREHIHHKLIDAGLTHGRTVAMMWLAALVACVCALGLVFGPRFQPVAILAAYSIVTIVVIRKLGYLRVRVTDANDPARSMRWHDRRVLVQAVCAGTRLVRRHEELDGLLLPCHHAHSYQRMRLVLPGDYQLEWVRAPEAPAEEHLTLRFELSDDHGPLGFVEYVYPKGASRDEVDDEKLFDQLHEALEHVATRFRDARTDERPLELVR